MAIVTKFHGVYYGVAPMIVEPEDRVDTGLHRASGGIDLGVATLERRTSTQKINKLERERPVSAIA